MKQPLLLLLTLLYQLSALSQDPKRFKEELYSFSNETSEEVKSLSNRILFTGSSSIRMWKDIQDRFPNQKILNRGFGGSEMSDLMYYLDDLVLKYQPKKVFIYEGDNDIANNEKPGKIIKEALLIVSKIKSDLPDTPIIFISAKPSLSRWQFQKAYIKYNKRLKKMCKREGLIFANVWNIMLDKDGNPKKDLFIEDGLHMTNKGYDLWAKVLLPLL